MLQSQVSVAEPLAFPGEECPPPCCRRLAALGIESLVAGLPLQRRRLRAKQYVFRTGQHRQSLFLIHAGFFKTCVLSQDGREKITGFRLRGDLLGMDALGLPSYACDAISLDVGEVWELPYAQLRDSLPEFQQRLNEIDRRAAERCAQLRAVRHAADLAAVCAQVTADQGSDLGIVVHDQYMRL